MAGPAERGKDKKYFVNILQYYSTIQLTLRGKEERVSQPTVSNFPRLLSEQLAMAAATLHQASTASYRPMGSQSLHVQHQGK